MGGGGKYDYAPLLAPGRHYFSMLQVETLAVAQFSGRARACRENLYYNFENVVQTILTASICCEIILDGSFLTEKPEPSDIDVKIYTDVEAHNIMSDYQMSILNGFNDQIYAPVVDITSFVTYPIGHECYGCALDPLIDGEDYGLGHSALWLKGYVVLRAGETDVGIRIRR
jgi:hypothetical protein